MLNKRGAIEVQFNWIFVLLVGGLIIAFFFVIINKQMAASELETQITVQTKLNNIMQKAKEDPNTLYTLTVSDVILKSGSCTEGLYINDNRNLRIEIDSAFSPDLIASQRANVMLWVLPWEMPMHVMNFMYVTNKDVRYIFVDDGNWGDDSHAELAFNDPYNPSFPEDLTGELVQSFPSGAGADRNNYKIRIVFFEEPVPATVPEWMKNYDLSAVSIVPTDGGLDGHGDVKYYSMDDAGNLQNDGETEFIGRASLFGAIIAENKESYECVMNNALNRLNIIADIYEKRSGELQTYYDDIDYKGLGTGNHPCASGIYDSAESAFGNMESKGITDAGDIYSQAKSITELSQKTKIKSCANVY